MFSLKIDVTGRRDRRLVRLGVLLFAVEDALLIDVDRVDDADDHAVDRQILGFGRQPGARALGDQHELAFARSDRVDGDEGSPGGDQPLALVRIRADRARPRAICGRPSCRPFESPRPSR